MTLAHLKQNRTILPPYIPAMNCGVLRLLSINDFSKAGIGTQERMTAHDADDLRFMIATQVIFERVGHGVVVQIATQGFANVGRALAGDQKVAVNPSVETVLERFRLIGIKRMRRIEKTAIHVVGRVESGQDQIAFVQRSHECVGQRAPQKQTPLKRAQRGPIDEVGEIQILKRMLPDTARLGDEAQELRDVVDFFVSVHREPLSFDMP